MKYIWVLFGFLIFVVGSLGIISPKEFLFDDSVTVDETRFVVFNKIRLLKTHKEWNPLLKKDPSIVYNFIGVDGTKGFVSQWKGDKISGEQEIKKIVEGERILYEIRLKSPIKATFYSTLVTTEEGDTKTHLRWIMSGHLSFPINVIFKILKMQQKIEYDFKEGTNVLKAILEKDI